MGKKLLQGLMTLGILGFFVYQNFFAYGSKLKFGLGNEVYYAEGATETDARRLGETLKTFGYFSDSSRSTVQIAKDGETYLLRFVVKEGAWNEAETKTLFAQAGYTIAESAFPGKKVQVELCDDHLRPEVRLDVEAPPADETAVDVNEEAAPDAKDDSGS